jgi:hypothetical protein
MARNVLIKMIWFNPVELMQKQNRGQGLQPVPIETAQSFYQNQELSFPLFRMFFMNMEL